MGKSVAELFKTLGEEEQRALSAAKPQYWPPMTARLSRQVFSDENWIFERKLDGLRCQAVREGQEVHLYDRSGKLLDANFPQIVEALERLPEDSVVDGEIVAFDRKQTRIELLQPYLYPDQDALTRAPSKQASKAAGAHTEKLPDCWFFLFDILQLGQRDLRNLPLVTRKKILRSAIRFSKPLQFTNHRKGEGERLFDIACRKGWEGIIGKRASSPYRSTRSRDWLKFRCDHQQELVIGGYTLPRGSGKEIGALLMGFFEGGKLRYAGKVGADFDYRTLDRLKRTMDRHRQPRSPFSDRIEEKNCHWLAPELVCQVGFSEWTRDRKLREPRYLGLRDDKNPREIILETPVEAA